MSTSREVILFLFCFLKELECRRRSGERGEGSVGFASRSDRGKEVEGA